MLECLTKYMFAFICLLVRYSHFSCIWNLTEKNISSSGINNKFQDCLWDYFVFGLNNILFVKLNTNNRNK